MWQEIENTEEAVCYERRIKGLSVRLEARQNEEEWTVYRGFYTDDGLNCTEQYVAQTREDALRMILRLRKEKVPSTSELNEMVKSRSKKVQLSMKRAYKDDGIEKWYFTVNEDRITNFFIVREFDKVEIDVVLQENYKLKEDEIMKQIFRFLSYENIFVDIEQNIYYFTKSDTRSSSKKSKILEKYEIEFDMRPK